MFLTIKKSKLTVSVFFLWLKLNNNLLKPMLQNQ
jgi:hypothetical protein